MKTDRKLGRERIGSHTAKDHRSDCILAVWCIASHSPMELTKLAPVLDVLCGIFV